jgi:hypothetical protein
VTTFIEHLSCVGYVFWYILDTYFTNEVYIQLKHFIYFTNLLIFGLEFFIVCRPDIATLLYIQAFFVVFGKTDYFQVHSKILLGPLFALK